MLINVATLLQEPIGVTRRYDATGETASVPAVGYRRELLGRVVLMRVGRGVIVMADLVVYADLECSRCLTSFSQPVTIAFDEEFVPERDMITGEATPDLDADEFRIDETHHLDLSEAVRQYEQSALPLGPLCSPECAGLCPTCGQNRNEHDCDCPRDRGDGRWSSLAGLADRLRSEE